MSKPRKYLKGERINTLLDAVLEVTCLNYVMVLDKPQHPGWIMSQPLGVLNGQVYRGHIYRALLNPEWVKWQEALQPEMVEF